MDIARAKVGHRQLWAASGPAVGLAAKKIQEIAQDAPVICVDGFKSTPDTERVKTLQARPQDSYLATAQPAHVPVGTFNGFKLDAALPDRIDYIFVSTSYQLLTYALLTDSLRSHYPSDHFPVVADMVLKQREAGASAPVTN